MSDIDSALNSLHSGEDNPLAPVREGLPPRYRMRADAHYVEQLDSKVVNSPIRFMDVHAIDNPRPDDGPTPSAAFVESIKRHGVLQPLLVRNRAGRHVVIAGRKRLAAAVAAGLREVPCLIERVDDDEAQTMAAATNVVAVESAGARAAVAPAPIDFPFGAFAECLTAVASSASLLAPGSTLTQVVAVDLVRAEAARALQLLIAMRVLRGEAAPARRPVTISLLLERTRERSVAERRLRGLTIDVDVQPHAPVTVWGDEELLMSALGTMVMSTAALIESTHGSSVTLRITRQGDESYVLTAVHGTELPHHWRSKLIEDAREPIARAGDVTTPALVLLRAARRIAELHGGHMTLDCADGRTNVSLSLPIGRA
jgi:ParB-like chromosome segregation protein Spo0J